MTKYINNKKNYKLEDLSKNKNTSGTKLIYNFFQPFTKKFLIIITIVFISTFSALLIPLLAQHAIDNTLQDPVDIPTFKIIIILAILLSLSAIITTYFQVRFTGFLGQQILFNIRQKLFIKLQNLPLRFFALNNSGDIIARLTSDVESINRFLSEGLIRFINIGFNLSGIFLMMLAINTKLTLIVLLFVFIIIIGLIIHGQILKKTIKKSLDLDAKVSNTIQEILNGFRIIKSFGREKALKKDFLHKNKIFFKYIIISNYINSLSDPFLRLISGICILIILLQGFELYNQNLISEGAIISYTIYLSLFFRPLRNIASLWKTIQDGLASSQRINEIMSLKTNIIQPQNAYDPDPDKIQGSIEFRNVSFAYESDNFVLKNINFKIKAGKTVAIVGPTGGGKTTFVNLIARLYDTDKGKVLIDNIDVKKWNLQKLRNQIGYLLQDTFLFSDTIFNNLKYSSDQITETQAIKTLKLLDAYDFVQKLPQKIHTKIQLEKNDLSTGQKQLIAITRMLLENPKILILDEATANIDTKTEKKVQKAIEIAKKNSTTFIIAHRLSTIKNADQIILIKDNQILEKGTHNELINRKSKYAQMYFSSRKFSS